MVSSLWSLAEQTAQQAKSSGALQSLQTSSEAIKKGSLSFHLRQISNLRSKKNASNSRPESHNPFLPYEQALFIAECAPHHNILLNKFNVLEAHILITTQQFEEQTSEITLADFQALYSCLQQDKALAFYNSGTAAGASQTHKHIQLVKLDKNDEPIPFEDVFANLNDEVPRQFSTLPFYHAALGLPKQLFDPQWCNPDDGAAQLKNLYDRLLAVLGIETINGLIKQPYNLLLTQDWMVVIPRSKESIEGVSLNALAFVGSILVADKKQALQIKSTGLAHSLSEVSGLI